jgi:hypothetical protein
MTKNQKIFGAIGLLAVGYIAYKQYKKGWTIFGKGADEVKVETTSEAMSNASGTMCRCDNGFTGRCESGDCNKCCGSYNRRKPARTIYRF